MFANEINEIRGYGVAFGSLRFESRGHQPAGRPCCACFSDLVAEQLRAFVPSQDPRVDCSGSRVELGPNAVRMLGMALHELATNSCKYGALSTQSGRLAISCEIDDARPERATIRWQESGGPEVAPPRR